MPLINAQSDFIQEYSTGTTAYPMRQAVNHSRQGIALRILFLKNTHTYFKKYVDNLFRPMQEKPNNAPETKIYGANTNETSSVKYRDNPVAAILIGPSNSENNTNDSKNNGTHYMADTTKNSY